MKSIAPSGLFFEPMAVEGFLQNLCFVYEIKLGIYLHEDDSSYCKNDI